VSIDTPQETTPDPLKDVDSAALVLAGIAGALVLFANNDNPWDFFSIIIGAVLVVVVTAFHRPLVGLLTIRICMLRLAFGAIFGIGFSIILAWPVQQLMAYRNPDNATQFATTFAVAAILPIAIIIALAEPWISDTLDRKLNRGSSREAEAPSPASGQPS
jgi:uncharacterized membrane protein YvlD (DUF360 family)